MTRRGDGFLQLGIDPPRRVIAPDSPPVRDALAQLAAGRRPDPADVVVARLCRELLEAELVVDADLLLADLEQAPVHATYGPLAGEVLARRARHGIAFVGPDALVATARSWLPSGLGRDPLVTCVLSDGALPRGQVDELVQAGRAHVVVERIEDRIELGPFVAVGLTACLRCIDAHRAEADPRRALVLEQYAAVRPGGHGVPDLVDAPVLAAALAWAVRDCLTYVDGFEPATWSRTVSVGPGMHRVEREWLRHPQCGCSWSELASD